MEIFFLHGLSLYALARAFGMEYGETNLYLPKELVKWAK
jgi:hypothetical protein